MELRIPTWQYGGHFAEELLNGIAFVADKRPPFKIESEGFKIYWAGTILRVDIDKKELE